MVFYVLVLCVILGVVGLNPLRLIVSLTSVIVGFAFMVGSASSKMFEGWLFILVRRPVSVLRNGVVAFCSNFEFITNQLPM